MLQSKNLLHHPLAHRWLRNRCRCDYNAGQLWLLYPGLDECWWLHLFIHWCKSESSLHSNVTVFKNTYHIWSLHQHLTCFSQNTYHIRSLHQHLTSFSQNTYHIRSLHQHLTSFSQNTYQEPTPAHHSFVTKYMPYQEPTPEPHIFFTKYMPYQEPTPELHIFFTKYIPYQEPETKSETVSKNKKKWGIYLITGRVEYKSN